MYGFIFTTNMKEKKNKREVSREKRRSIERENGQLLLFDGQSIDDKDYAIIRFFNSILI
jgi:hypothetical protein